MRPIGRARRLVVLFPTFAIAVVALGAACGTEEDERIVFQSVGGFQRGLYTMQPDGSGPVPLTSGAAVNWTPALSPDGTRIAWSRMRPRQNPHTDIYVMTLDAGEPVQVTSDETWENFAAWSPDGRRIVFQAGTLESIPTPTDGTARLYVINVDGSGRARLTTNEAAETTPSWSPDGKRIAFASNASGNWDIYVVGIDGTDQRRLTISPSEDVLPEWSADGSRIAFVSDRGNSREIYSIRLDGSEPERLTTASTVHPFSKMSWSPDGLSIAYSSIRNEDADIFAFSLRDGKETRLTDAVAADMSPSWGPSLRRRTSEALPP